jgi:PAS domain S-box-containing protein
VTDNRTRLNNYIYIFLIIVAIGVITFTGNAFVQQQKQLAIEDTRQDLAMIINLKTSQVVQWRKERMSEALSIYYNTMIYNRIKDYLSGHEKAEATKELSIWIKTLQNADGYSNVLIFDPRGEVLFSASPLTKPLAGDRDIIATAVKDKKVILSDLHIHKDAGVFDINLIIPILDSSAAQSECIAVIAIDIDPMINLYPLLRSWPIPSSTGENLLVKHDGDNVLYLNELRFQDNAAMKLRQPLLEKNAPAVRAVRGEEGVFEGKDYRGEDVIAAVRTIPDSPWAIVCKIDVQEALDPVSKRIWYVVGTCILVFLAFGLATFLMWRRKKESYILTLYDSELKFNRELKQAEMLLQEANNRLEERVASRTERLTATNTRLKQEIAERKQVEELLRRYFHVIQQSPVAIVITDLTGTIEFVNPKFCEYSGYSYEEAIGQNPRILKTDFTEPHIHRQLWETITRGETWNGEFCNRKKDGELYWEYAKILPVKDQKGTTVGYMGFKEDITRHKQLEEKLLQSRKLETIGQIAGGVAHEVRNPLNAILSITEALFREKTIEDNQEFTPYIQHIRTQVNRLANLMNDLLDLGKPVSPTNFHALGLQELCQETMELWRSSGMAGNRQGVVTSEGDASGIQVLGDHGKLQQVIFNLLENAGHHCPADGTVALQISGTLPDQGMAVVRIIDSGRGIPDSSIGRIFEPFFSDRKGGTGLGLPLVKHFIENMGGSVRIWNNDPPPGCTAELTIPLAAGEPT